MRGDVGACSLCEALEVNKTLAVLSLEGVQQPQYNNTKKSMVITSKEINKTDWNFHTAGTRSLIKALNINTTLTALYLGCLSKQQA